MNAIYEKLLKCLESVREKTNFEPKVALVLGSGLGGYAEKNIDVRAVVDYADIDGFPVSTVPGHKGRFVFGYIGGVSVVCMQGRVHYYEGYDMTDVVLPIRLMGMMGAKFLFLTNASGGINTDFAAGDLMLITGQISSFVPSPLRGANIDELGVRFPDMSSIYDTELCDAVREVAKESGIIIKEGTYIQTAGPNYESPDEIKMYALLGASAVGMSTACEAIAANHMGMRICGVSCISNMAAGISKTPLTHEEIQQTADKAAEKFERLVTGAVLRMGDMPK